MSNRKTEEMAYWYLRQILPEKPGVDSVQLSVLVELLDQHAEEAKVEQRQRSADVGFAKSINIGVSIENSKQVFDACLKATGKDNEPSL